MLTTTEIIENAVKAKFAMANASTDVKNTALSYAAEALVRETYKILEANMLDVEAANGTVSDVMLDRLMLNADRIKAMAQGILDVVKLDDPVGEVIGHSIRPNGLDIRKIAVPIGVIGIIYESRPNVTSDAAALCLKSGNVCILRGGKEAINSNTAIVEVIRSAIKEAGLPEDSINLITDTDHESANELMSAVGSVDLLIPRGGAGLIKACVENAKVPVIETGTGICHVYVDRFANMEKALDIIENAKTSRPSVCNAAEVCLVDRDIARYFLPKMYDRLVLKRALDGKPPVEFRLDQESFQYILGIPALMDDYDTEFLDYILAIKVVDGIDEAIEHIRQHSTGHSDAIVTEDRASQEKFVKEVDSAAVYINASTRFTDGGEFGLGCEIGISTQKMHARGPMGLKEMTSYKYIVTGDGQIR